MATYRCHVVEQFGEIGDDAINVLILLHKPVAFAVGDLADHIEGVELKPLGEVTALSLVHEQLLRLLQE